MGINIESSITEFSKQEADQILLAVQELRNQIEMRKVINKEPYPGIRSGIDPFEFFLEHYGEELRGGRIGPGGLFKIDHLLEASMRRRLANASPPETLRDWFDRHVAEDKVEGPYARRLKACATILGISPEETVRFFGSLRSPRSEGPSSSRSVRTGR